MYIFIFIEAHGEVTTAPQHRQQTVHTDVRSLKILPSGHSSATWCIMVNVSMWCLPTTAHKEWCARYYYRNDKESYTFQRQNPNISVKFFNKSMLDFVV